MPSFSSLVEKVGFAIELRGHTSLASFQPLFSYVAHFRTHGFHKKKAAELLFVLTINRAIPGSSEH
jgi:hypothetical protein